MSSHASPNLNTFVCASQQRAKPPDTPADDHQLETMTATTDAPSSLSACEAVAFERFSSHRFHTYVTLTNKVKIIKWMIFEVAHAGTKTGIQYIKIAQFPQLSKTSHCANFIQAKRLWDKRNEKISHTPGSGQKSQNCYFCVWVCMLWQTTSLDKGSKIASLKMCRVDHSAWGWLIGGIWMYE